MALTVGSQLGHYDVTALIGEGGMGQVYQATDTKLNRQVALKILPEAFATDPDRLARFQREAQVLASLNHPGIAAIYGIEPSAAGQDRRAADGDRVAVREGGPVGGRRPFGPAEVDAMSGAQSISTRRAYGVQRVCRVWHRARSSVYARRQATRSPALCRRRGPIGAAPDDVLVAHLRRVLEASPFYGEGYRKAWAKLRVEGVRTSKERVRRLMREHDLQAPQRTGHAHGPKAHDGTITTEAPDVMWGTDMTATSAGSPTRSGTGPCSRGCPSSAPGSWR